MNSSTANHKIAKDNPEKEPFFTISHESVEQGKHSVRYGNKEEENKGQFNQVKSSELRKSYET